MAIQYLSHHTIGTPPFHSFWLNKKVYIIPAGISLKVNVSLSSELAYYDVTVQYISRYATGNLVSIHIVRPVGAEEFPECISAEG